MAMRPDFLFGLACPQLHLWRSRRWVGVVLIGLVWIRATRDPAFDQADLPIWPGGYLATWLGCL
jgi:hypothetical protein